MKTLWLILLLSFPAALFAAITTGPVTGGGTNALTSDQAARLAASVTNNQVNVQFTNATISRLQNTNGGWYFSGNSFYFPNTSFQKLADSGGNIYYSGFNNFLADASGNLYYGDVGQTLLASANGKLHGDGSLLTGIGNPAASVIPNTNSALNFNLSAMIGTFQGNLFPLPNGGLWNNFFGYQNLSAAVWTNGTATYTCNSTHNYSNGTIVVIGSVTPSGYNTTTKVTNILSATKFQVSLPSNPGAYVSGGNSILEPDVLIRPSSPNNPAMLLAANANSVPLGLDPHLPVWGVVSSDGNINNVSFTVLADGHSWEIHFGGYLAQFANGILQINTPQYYQAWTTNITAHPGDNFNTDLAYARNSPGLLEVTDGLPTASGGHITAGILTSNLTLLGGALVKNLTVTNGPTLGLTNVAPAGLAIGVTLPVRWFPITNAGAVYLVPGYAP